MSSKFFTWTKGDRRNASEALCTAGVVPIPVECIQIKGFDYSRTPKTGHRRPAPLTLEQTQEPTSPFALKTEDSTALQDAAVKSATSLIAVVNDMLRSPQPPAQLRPKSASLAPPFGRPRSHTAPPTPLQEAPTQSLVELPGSIPERPQAGHHHSFDGNLRATVESPRPKERLTVSHNRGTHPWLRVGQKRHESDCNSAHGEDTPTHLSTSQSCVEGELPIRTGRPTAERPSYHDQRKSQARRSSSISRDLIFSEAAMIASPRLSAGVSVDGSADPKEQTSLPPQEQSPAHAIASLRASHVAHVEALTELHHKEVASIREYASVLERHHGFSHLNPPSELPLRSNERVQPHSTTSNISLEHRLSCRSSSWPLQGNVGSSLLYAPSHQPFTTATEREEAKSDLHSVLQACDRRTVEYEKQIRGLKESELSLKDTISSLQSQLTAANQRFQNGLLEVNEQMRRLLKRESSLMQELEELRKRRDESGSPSTAWLSDSDMTGREKTRHHRATSDISYEHTRSASLLAKIAELNDSLESKDARIQQLETQCKDLQSQWRDKRKKTLVRDAKKHLIPRKQSCSNETIVPSDARAAQSDALKSSEDLLAPSAAMARQSVLRDITTPEVDEVGQRRPEEAASCEARRSSAPPKTRAYRPQTRGTSPAPSLSSSQTSSPSALGISIPQTPRTVASATTETLQIATEDPKSFTQPRTPPLRVHKRLPRLPTDASPPPAHSPVLRRDGTVKSVRESIIELYASREGYGRESGIGVGQPEWNDDVHWVEWV